MDSTTSATGKHERPPTSGRLDLPGTDEQACPEQKCSGWCTCIR